MIYQIFSILSINEQEVSTWLLLDNGKKVRNILFMRQQSDFSNEWVNAARRSSSGLRILIYSQDGYGLGHMRRTQAIAKKLLSTSLKATVVTLSDSPLNKFFDLPTGHNYIKLPSIVKIAPGVWQPISSKKGLSEVLLSRRELIYKTITNFKPDLFIIDHMPHGALGELVPSLEYLKEHCKKTRIILGLRDILDTPDVIYKMWTQEGAYQAVEYYYDSVMVYGQREIFDLFKEYQFPQNIQNRGLYCGYVCTPMPPTISHTAPQIRKTYLSQAEAGTKLIIIMAGGGRDGFPMMDILIDALPTILDELPVVVVLITGPFLSIDLQQQLRAKISDLPIHMFSAVYDTLSYIEAADLIIAMAGYNTTVEILRSGKPAIFIPRPGPSAEQRTRCQLFLERGWISMVAPKDLNIERLASSTIDALRHTKPIHPEIGSCLQGLTTVTNHLLSF